MVSGAVLVSRIAKLVLGTFIFVALFAPFSLPTIAYDKPNVRYIAVHIAWFRLAVRLAQV